MKKYLKWIGGGLGWVLGGPMGAILGFALGSIDDNSSFPIEVNCGLTNVTSPNTSIYFNSCDANPGIGSSFIPICGTEPFCLFNELSGEPQSDGLWTGPSGWTADECGTYNPTTDPAGDYSYTVAGEGGCQLTSTTYLGLNDLGTVPTVTYCQSAAVSLFNLLVSPVPITNGVWYYPESAGGGIVPASIVNPLVDPTGLYTYQFLNSNQCASLLSAEVRFTNEGRSGESTTVDYCPLQGDFCPLNLLEGNPDPGGVWILYNANYGFQGFEPISEICYTPNQLLLKFGSNIVNGFSMVYIIGNPPCAPSIDTLTVNYITPFDNNCSSISGIVNIGENCGSRIATLQAFYPDATNPFETYNLLVDELGHFEVGVSLPPHVNLSLKMVGYLSTSINGVTLINGENSLDFGTPKAGDIGGDNIINMVDVSLLNTAFLSVYGDVNFNRNADLNCNGIVNLVDASLLSSAFGLSGE